MCNPSTKKFFRSKDNDCRFLAMAELFLVDYARKKQEERWQIDEFWMI